MKTKQPVSIDGIEFDALIEESIGYEAEVPAYPTEKGYAVSDNISLKPYTLTMTLYLSDTPVTWKQRFGDTQDRVIRQEQKLKDLYFARKIISVTASDKVYPNMAITSLSIGKSADKGYAKEVSVTLQEVVTTETKTVTMPGGNTGKGGASKKSTGTANKKVVVTQAGIRTKEWERKEAEQAQREKDKKNGNGHIPTPEDIGCNRYGGGKANYTDPFYSESTSKKIQSAKSLNDLQKKMQSKK